eukprot:CAMPEP_0174828840 /NCGR_PEP_ID=MMETSP1114-20130205/1564_1 /TAXON_ID=312471 /ORGANISM="Neobodo designis, Strain CCAP 1951/1" /LENGTH=190 /DNA_ID=CAMNT_0016062567 /DNA_START=63 /DNA_END=635 /DNA_ORIENTATION=-
MMRTTLLVSIALWASLAYVVAANDCYGKDIGDGDCCGREGDTVYWCTAGTHCDGLTQCSSGDSSGGGVGSILGIIAAILIWIAICVCCCRRVRTRGNNNAGQTATAARLRAEREPLYVNRSASPVVVVAAAVPSEPRTGAYPVQPSPQSPVSPGAECPYAPASDVYGYGYQPKEDVLPATGNNDSNGTGK